MDINERLILDTVRDTGHLWDPSYPEVLNVDGPSFAKLVARDRAARDAIASMQRADANFEDLVWAEHKRAPRYDGDIGPATMKLVAGWNTAGSPLSRCPLPDFAPPQGAAFHYDEPELQKAVEQMQRAAIERATGTGSIPPGCYGNPKVHEVKVSYDLSRLSSKQREWFAEIKTRHSAGCAAIGLKIIEVPVGERANVNFYGRSFGGSTIGMAGFLGTSCGANVFCTISPNYAPDLEMVLILVFHEHGHNWNCNHRPGYIMNPSIRRVKPAWVERDATGKITYADPSYTADLRHFFGGGPLDPIIAPPPPPPPPVGDKTIGEWELAAGKYRLVKVGGGKPDPEPW